MSTLSDLRRAAANVVLTGLSEEALRDGFACRVASYPFGGFIFFDRNAKTRESLRALTDRLRACYPQLPPILAIDQEGGSVMRLREGVEALPPASDLGATEDEGLCERIGTRCAFDLRRAGCNLNFAPVLDLAVEPRNTVVGSRAFGSDPRIVARLAGAFARGLENGGVVATFKHFPGHGSTIVDSHVALPVVELDEVTLRARDLLPFTILAPRARAMMTAHVVVPALDAQLPATLSPRVHSILREEFGFKGVCFTDCLQMAAIADVVGSVEGAIAALRAGADMAIVSHNLDLAVEVVERIECAVEGGELSWDRLSQASGRVDALRSQLAPPLESTDSR